MTRALSHFPIALSLFAGAALLFTACGDDGSADDGRTQVVTTLPLFADFVRNVGGDRVEVHALIPNGADPHTFEPSPRDVERIADADIAFANGLGLEPGLIEVLEANLPDEVELVKLGEKYLESLGSPSPPAPMPSQEPHAWMNWSSAISYVNIVWESLTAVDQDGSNDYAANFQRYHQEIGRELGAYIGERSRAIPPENRKLVTAHDAFSHLARYWNLQIVAVVARSPGQEPSPQDIADLREAIERENIPAVFTEPQIDEESEILRQAAEDAGVLVCTLYSDSLDDEVSTYIEMMRFNADELARCLGGNTDG